MSTRSYRLAPNRIPYLLSLAGLLAIALGSRVARADRPVVGPEAAPRMRRCLNADWRFHRGDPNASYYRPGFDDAEWEAVSVPHSLALTSLALDGCQDDKTQATFQRDVGWYRRTVRVTADPQRRVFLVFEGAHQVTDVWVNGRHAGQHAISGYTPFHVDISGLVRRGGGNQVTLRVDNRRRVDVPPDPGPFDYIKFSGLYRDVYLVETNPVHVPFPWEGLETGIALTTPTVDPLYDNAIVAARTTVRNGRDTTVAATVVTRVIDRRGIVVLRLSETQTLPPGQDRVYHQIGALAENVHFWSCDDPYLYRVHTEIRVGERPVDVQVQRLGIRRFELDPQRGFLLNGEPIELIGANRHQHYGYIGDALPNALHRKDMLQFKALGFNVVRTAHYPQDDALIEACDELGILVYEEAPTWISMSQEPVWWDRYEQALRRTIRNHRNHPSVVIWGTGVNHRGPVERAVLAAKQEDPTRLTASQSSRWTGWQCSGLTDVFANMMYGPGIWDRREPLLAMEGGSGPAVVAEYKRDPLKLGMISWTAHAYYTFHPSKNPADRTRSGMMTVFRVPRPNTLWYPSEMRPEPYVYVREPWTEGTESLTVYSNAAEVELWLNGRLLTRGGPSRDARYEGLEHPPFELKIPRYEPGTLEVRGLRDGAVFASQTLHTPEEPVRLELTLDTSDRAFEAGGADILVGYARVVDNHGTVIKDRPRPVRFSVQGPARIVGDGRGIGANPCTTRDGIAPVLVRSQAEPGRVTVTAESEGLGAGRATVETIPPRDDAAILANAPFYDIETLRVDIGAEDQLLQFGWTPWNGTDNAPSTQSFDAFGGFTAHLATASTEGVLRWLGEMNVIGRLGFVYGEGVLAVDREGLLLRFQGLPAGSYRLRTWHHAPRSNTDSMDPNRDRLRQLTIHKLPYARRLRLTLSDAAGTQNIETPVTEGKEMQFAPAAVAALLLTSDGTEPITLRLSDPEGRRGIWLNAFELSSWPRAVPVRP